MRYVNINTDTTIFPPMEEQESISQNYNKEHPEYFNYITSFAMKGWETQGWMESTINQIENA